MSIAVEDVTVVEGRGDAYEAPGLTPSCANVAFHGPAGALVRAVEPHSEADPAALLVQALVAFGNCVGRSAHFRIEGDEHYLNLFVVLVGATGEGRKGTSWGQVRRFFEQVDSQWVQDNVKGGLVSGEGLTYAVRDPVVKGKRQPAGAATADPFDDNGAPIGGDDTQVEYLDLGVADKRLLCLESEFASVLQAAARSGSTLSALIRQAWDGHPLRTLKVKDPITATGAHVSIIGHITAEELHRCLSATEQANGFGNRFLWVLVRQSKLLPEGGAFDVRQLGDLVKAFRAAAGFASSLKEPMGFDPAGRALWHGVYKGLSAGRPGLAGALLGRAAPQVRRLACVYAVLDQSAQVQRIHVRAALALWRYAVESVRAVFGESLGDGVADELLRLLRANPPGVTRDEMRQHFGRHISSEQIGRALGLLVRGRLAHHVMEPTAGRPAERWFAGPGPAP